MCVVVGCIRRYWEKEFIYLLILRKIKTAEKVRINERHKVMILKSQRGNFKKYIRNFKKYLFTNLRNDI